MFENDAPKQERLLSLFNSKKLYDQKIIVRQMTIGNNSSFIRCTLGSLKLTKSFLKQFSIAYKKSVQTGNLTKVQRKVLKKYNPENAVDYHPPRRLI